MAAKTFTLYDCFVSSEKMNVPGFDTVSYVANHFYAGSRLIESEREGIIEGCT